MKSILAFGDSLTWGYNASTGMRMAHEDRWPNVLAAGLQNRARVIEEGMNGRTTVFDDPTVEENRNGAVGLPIALKTGSASFNVQLRMILLLFFGVD